MDLHVKKTIVGDSLKLVKKLAKGNGSAEVNSFLSLIKIYPDTSDRSCLVSEKMNQLRRLYYDIAQIKSKLNITSSNFEKILAKSSYLKATGVQSVDLNLLFLKQTQSLKSLEFHDFFWLV